LSELLSAMNVFEVSVAVNLYIVCTVFELS